MPFLELLNDDGGLAGWFPMPGREPTEDGDLIVPGFGVVTFRDLEYGTGASRLLSFVRVGDLIRSANDLN